MNLYDICKIKYKEPIYQQSLYIYIYIYIYIYTKEENKTINESTITDRITCLTNKRSNNKDSYYLKGNTKDQEKPYEYEVKTSPPTDHSNIPSLYHNHVNSTPEEQICNMKAKLVALKSFVIEQIYVLKNALKKRNFYQKVVTS